MGKIHFHSTLCFSDHFEIILFGPYALMDTFIILLLLSWNVHKHKRSVLIPNWMTDTLFWSLFTCSCFTVLISLQLTRFIMIKIKWRYLENAEPRAVLCEGICFALLTVYIFLCLTVSVLPLLKGIKKNSHILYLQIPNNIIMKTSDFLLLY